MRERIYIYISYIHRVFYVLPFVYGLKILFRGEKKVFYYVNLTRNLFLFKYTPFLCFKFVILNTATEFTRAFKKKI